jgi:hypothetical protein
MDGWRGDWMDGWMTDISGLGEWLKGFGEDLDWAVNEGIKVNMKMDEC